MYKRNVQFEIKFWHRSFALTSVNRITPNSGYQSVGEKKGLTDSNPRCKFETFEIP